MGCITGLLRKDADGFCCILFCSRLSWKFASFSSNERQPKALSWIVVLLLAAIVAISGFLKVRGVPSAIKLEQQSQRSLLQNNLVHKVV